MNEKNIFESNRFAWNQALKYHQKARNNSLQIGFEDSDFTVLDRDCDDVLINKLNDFDFTGKTIAQMPCNNGRELLSLMKLGAKDAVGFDISDTAILEAEQLAGIAKINAKFVRINILEISEEYNDCFDFIYISEGSLQWFPDLTEYFSVVSRLLKPNGSILIYEIHPFAYFFENGFSFEKQNFEDAISYFEKGPYNYKDGFDYIGGVQYEAKKCYWFMHSMSEILGSIRQCGIEIIEFDEYNLEMANNPEVKMLNKFPLSYILTGKMK